MAPISVFMITLNAERHLEKSLASLKWADEIVLVDSGSTDRTLEIAIQYGAKLIHRPFQDYSDQKNYAMQQTQNEWALSIDADEEVTPDLRDEILKRLANPQDFVAFKIPRKSFIFGRAFRYSGTQNDSPIRLMKKSVSTFCQPIHEFVQVDGKIGTLQEKLNHYTYNSVADYLNRLNRYTSREAAFLKEQHKTISWIDVSLRPAAKFFRQYFFERGFLDGFEGFLFAALSSCYIVIKYFKYRELLRTESKACSPK